MGWNYVSGLTPTFAPSTGAGQEFASLPDGLQVAAISTNGSGGDINQTLSALLTANTTYTLTFWVGQRSDYPFDPSYQVSLTANGITLASDSGASPAAGDFVSRTIVFDSGSSPVGLGQALGIDISTPFGSPGQTDFDMFTLTASPTSGVPEPSSFLLLVLASLFTFGFCWRKSRV